MDHLITVLVFCAIPFLIRFGWSSGKILAHRWFDK